MTDTRYDTIRWQSCAVLLGVALLSAFLPALARTPAFPGAVGYGKNAAGWRGGEVFAITSLADGGPGTLRQCATNAGRPRVCVFRVSGTIEVSRPIKAGSNLYIAGQTAPGKGVQLRLKGPRKGSNHTPLVVKNVDNVLIRFLKLRPGTTSAGKSANVDAITIEGSRHVYLDHLSMSFASDETLNVHVNTNPTHDITVANSILSFSLDRSIHPKGRHSKGALICSNEGPVDLGIPCGRITLYRNLFAHHRDRNPDLKATDIGPVDVLNNVFYDVISQYGEFYDLLGDLSVNYVGNLALAGPSTRRRSAPRAIEAFDWNKTNRLSIFASDNLNLRRPGCSGTEHLPVVDEAAERFLVPEPVALPSAPTQPVDHVLEAVLAGSGATTAHWGGHDVLDRRAIEDVRRCQGRVIDTPDEVGGWPDLPASSAPSDSDADGMPDAWETARGLNPADPGDNWADEDGDGWSNIEAYLAELSGDTL